ncbi:MAG: hypothetical protein JWO31_1094 [Phycisphaerales bacterium]|nr:hypothetical protein [Phycisphaerales bacterium]
MASTFPARRDVRDGRRDPGPSQPARAAYAVGMATALTRRRPLAVAILFAVTLASLGIGPSGTKSPKRAEVTATGLSVTALKPGASAEAAVVLEIKPGYHSQSAEPLEKNLIAFTVTVEPPAGVTAGKPVFPAGHVKEYPLLGKLSVYDGRVVVRVPLQVAADAKPGDVTIAGTLNYQICDDKTCFPPTSTPFTVAAKIVGPADDAKPANAELFAPAAADGQPATDEKKSAGATKPAGGTKVGKPIDPKARASVDAALDASALRPGRPARLAVVVDVAAGFHAQSNVPGEKSIPTTVDLKPAAGVAFGPPAYPPGRDEAYVGVGTLSVYTGRAVVVVPVDVKPDAAVGSTVTLAGTVTVQICDDKGVCYPPLKLPFEVAATVAAADDPVAANEPELFAAGPTVGPTPGGEAGGTVATAAVVRPVTSPAADASARAERNPLAGYSLPAVFGIAFLVGILFNVVPCVLPVLPLKAVGFYETAQHDRLRSLSFGAVFGLGVMFAFAVLGLLVVVLKVVAWGELYSNPYFKSVMVVILSAMALNMFGLFTVNLPTRAYMFSPRHDTYFGNFLFGILTAALSTPCTFGLFVGVLLCAATLPAIGGLALVVTVGLGMASPYVALSATPELARKFPRTGPWAELVKQLMGFMLLAVAVFFANDFLQRAVSEAAVWWLIFVVIAAGAAFLVARSVQYGKTATAPIVAVTIAVLMVGTALAGAWRLTAKPYQWQAYTPAALAEAQARNQIVLVEFTASWCTNCHYLEGFVLNAKGVQQVVRDHDVRMVKADLSDTAAPGWDLLKNGLQAEGVPLTVIYSPNLPAPIQLVGIYSQDDLRAAFAQAASPRTAMR